MFLFQSENRNKVLMTVNDFLCHRAVDLSSSLVDFSAVRQHTSCRLRPADGNIHALINPP